MTKLHDLETQYELESLIDAFGLSDVLRSIAILCGDKADLIRSGVTEIRPPYNIRAEASAWDKRCTALIHMADDLDD